MKRCGCLLLLLACGTAYCQPGWAHGSHPKPIVLTTATTSLGTLIVMPKITRGDGSDCQITDALNITESTTDSWIYHCVPPPEPADVPAIQVVAQMCVEHLSTGECVGSLYDTPFICTDRERFLLQRSDGEWRCIKF